MLLWLYIPCSHLHSCLYWFLPWCSLMPWTCFQLWMLIFSVYTCTLHTARPHTAAYHTPAVMHCDAIWTCFHVNFLCVHSHMVVPVAPAVMLSDALDMLPIGNVNFLCMHLHMLEPITPAMMLWTCFQLWMLIFSMYTCTLHLHILLPITCHLLWCPGHASMLIFCVCTHTCWVPITPAMMHSDVLDMLPIENVNFFCVHLHMLVPTTPAMMLWTCFQLISLCTHAHYTFTYCCLSHATCYDALDTLSC